MKARYVGVCRGCGDYRQPRNGEGEADTYCMAGHLGAIQPKWSRKLALDANACLADSSSKPGRAGGLADTPVLRAHLQGIRPKLVRVNL